MRVISQKDMPVIIDLPYERIGISQSYKEPNYIIGFDTLANDDDCFYLAKYSTQEKVEKAMQKLRECYLGIHVVEKLNDTVDCSSLSQIGIYKKNENGDYAYKLPAGEKIFRFPQDDEL